MRVVEIQDMISLKLFRTLWGLDGCEKEGRGCDLLTIQELVCVKYRKLYTKRAIEILLEKLTQYGLVQRGVMTFEMTELGRSVLATVHEEVKKNPAHPWNKFTRPSNTSNVRTIVSMNPC